MGLALPKRQRNTWWRTAWIGTNLQIKPLKFRSLLGCRGDLGNTVHGAWRASQWVNKCRCLHILGVLLHKLDPCLLHPYHWISCCRRNYSSEANNRKLIYSFTGESGNIPDLTCWNTQKTYAEQLAKGGIIWDNAACLFWDVTRRDFPASL